VPHQLAAPPALENQEIIVCEEIKQQAMDTRDENLVRIVSTVQELEAELIVPSLDDNHLIAVIVLGKKKSGEMYSPDDLMVFSILANQSAVGIENALFYEETGKGLVEKFHEKRLKFLGELGSGVAHQMNNRFNVMTMASGVGLEEINEKDINTLSREELIQIINYNKGILEKIGNSALKGKEIAEAIKTYSKASVVPSAITLEKSISSSLNLLACKFKIEYLNMKKEYPPDIYVWANLSTLQEVLSNAIDNSHDAMRTKEGLVKSQKIDVKEYKPELIIKAGPENDVLRIEIIDNGIGMKPEELDKVFVPFFTTKGASKGTGMGLNMMKQLLEKNQGSIEINSTYEVGTQVTLKVPLATQEQVNQTKEETDES
jgi:signal transduction histidine kinase